MHVDTVCLRPEFSLCVSPAKLVQQDVQCHVSPKLRMYFLHLEQCRNKTNAFCCFIFSLSLVFCVVLIKAKK